MALTTEPIAPELLALLRCPATMQSLRVATVEELGKINTARFMENDLSPAVLVREDGLVAYSIVDGVPVLLPNAAVVL